MMGAMEEASRLDPQAEALLARLERAGVRPVSEQTPAAARRSGLLLADLADQAAGSAAIVRHLNRIPGDDAAGIAAALGLDPGVVAERIATLAAAGGILSRPRPDGSTGWTVRIAGRRRARSAGGALHRLTVEYAIEAATEETDLGVLLGDVRDATIAPGVEVRIYRPEGAGTEPLPLILFIHGGGWVIGSIAGYDALCRSLMAGTGCVVASAGYRLAPEHPFPAAVEDVERILLWLLAHAGALGIDPERVAVAGDSVGGGLATVLAARARDEAWCRVLAQVLLYPVTDATRALPSYETHRDAPLLSRADMEWYYRHYAPPAGDWRASPLHLPDLTGLPPALFLLAEVDPVHDDGVAWADRLRGAGIATEVVDYPGSFHGFALFAPALDAAVDAQARGSTFLRAHLRPGGTAG